eukprot:2380435-Pyramimonas_sp.AAC.1
MCSHWLPAGGGSASRAHTIGPSLLDGALSRFSHTLAPVSLDDRSRSLSAPVFVVRLEHGAERATSPPRSVAGRRASAPPPAGMSELVTS